MRMTTCLAGIDLMKDGYSFYAWDTGTYNDGITQVDIEVPDGAYKVGEAVDDEGRTVQQYDVICPELVKIVSEKY
jgi:hypothetical protein